jgi:hypothetical protein
MLLDVALLKEVTDGLPRNNPPDVLWHYTSVAFAKAILESRTINLCCHAFMNDPAEGIVAGTMVSDCWATVVGACSGHPHLDLDYVRDATRALAYFDFGRPELPPTFLFSLTELRDSLSQWSRYGDNGAGIALGFAIDPSELPTGSNRPWRTSTGLIQVAYDGGGTVASSELRALIAAVLSRYLPQFQSPTQVENTITELIHALNPMVKNAAYVEEREWRISTRTVAESQDVYKIGCNRFGIAPYVPLPLGGGVTLVELMLGPKLSKENLWSAKWLCGKFGHAPTISMSALAYR